MNPLPSSAPNAFPPPRATPNAAHACGGIWRLTARRFSKPGHWLMLAAMLALLVVFSIPAAPNHTAARQGLLPWAAGFYVCFLVPVLAFISGGGAMRDDLGPATVDYVFTRPVRRPAYVVFRYLAQMACAQIDFLFSLAVIAGLGVFHGVPGLWSALPLLLLGQAMAVIAFSAFGFFCGMITSRYVIIGLAYGGLVEIGLGNVPTQLSQLSLARHVLALLRPVLGDTAGLSRLAKVSTFSPLEIVALLLAFSAVMVALTAALLSLREFTGSGREA